MNDYEKIAKLNEHEDKTKQMFRYRGGRKKWGLSTKSSLF